MGCVALAMVATAIAVGVDAWRTTKDRTDEGLRWAGWVTAQVERTARDGTARGIQDPLAWAVSQVASSAPAGVNVHSARVTSGESHTKIHRYDPETGDFDFMQAVRGYGGAGLRIRIAWPSAGFLGSRTGFGQDFTVGLFFAVALLLGLLTLKAFHSEWKRVPVAIYISRWTGQVQEQLKRFAVQLRDFLREAKAMIQKATDAQRTLHELEERMAAGVERSKRADRAVDRLVADVSALDRETRGFVKEADKYGVRPLVLLAERADLRGKAVGDSLRECRDAIKALGGELEEWKASADEARQGFDGVLAQGAEMRERVGRVSLLFQDAARQVQDLKGEFARDDVTATHERPSGRAGSA